MSEGIAPSRLSELEKLGDALVNHLDGIDAGCHLTLPVGKTLFLGWSDPDALSDGRDPTEK